MSCPECNSAEGHIGKDGILRCVRCDCPFVVTQSPLQSKWHHGAGYLCCGTIRIAREDVDTNPSDEFKGEMFDWIVKTLNAAEESSREQLLSELDSATKLIGELEAKIAKFPHTKDGVLVYPGVTVYCRRGHPHVVHQSETGRRIYCLTGECKDEGCQGDSSSGTYHNIMDCTGVSP